MSPQDSLVFENPQTAPNVVPIVRASSDASPSPAGSAATQRKNKRLEQRELLYTVVRDAMLRAGVLAASYKFKVLSLDPLGRQYLIMVDLSSEWATQAGLVAQIELAIVKNSQARHDITVTGVYWRTEVPTAAAKPMPAVNGLAKDLERLPRTRQGKPNHLTRVDLEDFKDTEALGTPEEKATSFGGTLSGPLK